MAPPEWWLLFGTWVQTNNNKGFRLKGTKIPYNYKSNCRPLKRPRVFHWGNLCNHTPRGKILPFGNLTFYFSNSMDFVKNKSPFIHCNSDIEEPSKNTLIHFDIINYSAKSCST